MCKHTNTEPSQTTTYLFSDMKRFPQKQRHPTSHSAKWKVWKIDQSFPTHSRLFSSDTYAQHSCSLSLHIHPLSILTLTLHTTPVILPQFEYCSLLKYFHGWAGPSHKNLMHKNFSRWIIIILQSEMSHKNFLPRTFIAQNLGDGKNTPTMVVFKSSL